MSGLNDGDLDRFVSLVAQAKSLAEAGAVPEVEVPRRVIEYHNKGNIKGFDSVGYFVFNGVKVYEKGKKEEAKSKEGRTMEQLLHGNGRQG